jgi:hypothetical protein
MCGWLIGDSKPADGVWETYVSEDAVANNNLCYHCTSNLCEEGESWVSLSLTWPERIQEAICKFVGKGFQRRLGGILIIKSLTLTLLGPVAGRHLMGVSYWRKPNSEEVKIRIHWNGDKWCVNSDELPCFGKYDKDYPHAIL